MTEKIHRFLDETGDTAIIGKGNQPLLGKPGVSMSFGLGMLKVNEPLDPLRQAVRELESSIQGDRYFASVPSVVRRIAAGGFLFHAKDDIPEIRERMLRLIAERDLSLEMVVARKIPVLFERKHHNNESEFYADVLSHLIKNKLEMGKRLVLNIAEKGNSTRNANLERALAKAKERRAGAKGAVGVTSEVVFNINTPRNEPLLRVVDYLCWAVQRVFEKGEMRHYEFLRSKMALIVDLYDVDGYAGSKNYYTRERPLTAQNRLSPPPP